MAEQFVVLESLWRDAEGKAVRLEPEQISDARRGRLDGIFGKLTIPGQVFTAGQVEEYGLEEFVRPRSPELREKIHAQHRAEQEEARAARVEALRAELENLEAEEA